MRNSNDILYKITPAREFCIKIFGCFAKNPYLCTQNVLKLGSKNSDNTGDLYILRATGKSKYWYVSYYLENKPARLKEKLAARAKSVGLVGSDKLDDDNKIETVYTNQKYVDMLILSLE